MTDQDRIHELNYRIAKERENCYRRELVQLACESVKRDLALAKLEAEVIASREIVRKAVERAEELERLMHVYRDETARCRTAENAAAVELEKIRTVLGIVRDPRKCAVMEVERLVKLAKQIEKDGE